MNNGEIEIQEEDECNIFDEDICRKPHSKSLGVAFMWIPVRDARLTLATLE